MFCTECGVSLTKAMKFCSSCGKAQPEANSEAVFLREANPEFQYENLTQKEQAIYDFAFDLGVNAEDNSDAREILFEEGRSQGILEERRRIQALIAKLNASSTSDVKTLLTQIKEYASESNLSAEGLNSKSKVEMVKDIVLSWLELEPTFNSESGQLFYGYFDTMVEDKNVSRPVYFFFADITLFMDAPICLKTELANPTDSFGAWGFSSIASTYTYHNVVTHDMVLANPEAFKYLVGMIVSQAGEKELEIIGEIKFLSK